MQTKELELRCPFCGDAGVIYRRLDCCWLAECRDDSCVAGSSAQAYDTEAEALAAWNTRLPTSSGGRGEAWRPIESAPRDGTDVLIWNSEGHEIARWTDREEDGSDQPGNDEGWVGTYAFPGRSWGNRLQSEPQGQPTHWMPLPASPSQERCGDLVEASQSLRSVPQSALPEAWGEVVTRSREVAAQFSDDDLNLLAVNVRFCRGAMSRQVKRDALHAIVGLRYLMEVTTQLPSAPTSNHAASAAAIPENPENVQGEA